MPVELSRRQWRRLVEELGRRGGGKKESGAFLLANASGNSRVGCRRLRRVVYYDDLEAECLTGGISMTALAYDRLWTMCAEEKLTVVADCHTHPGRYVSQSPIDQRNPMLATVGHLAFIIPHYGTRRVSPDHVGAYEYLGRHTWRTIRPPSNALRVNRSYDLKFIVTLRKRLWRRHKIGVRS